MQPTSSTPVIARPLPLVPAADTPSGTLPLALSLALAAGARRRRRDRCQRRGTGHRHAAPAGSRRGRALARAWESKTCHGGGHGHGDHGSSGGGGEPAAAGGSRPCAGAMPDSLRARLRPGGGGAEAAERTCQCLVRAARPVTPAGHVALASRPLTFWRRLCAAATLAQRRARATCEDNVRRRRPAAPSCECRSPSFRSAAMPWGSAPRARDSSSSDERAPLPAGSRRLNFPGGGCPPAGTTPWSPPSRGGKPLRMRCAATSAKS